MQNPLLEQYGIRNVVVSLGLLSEKYLEQIDLIAKKWWGQSMMDHIQKRKSQLERPKRNLTR